LTLAIHVDLPPPWISFW